MTAEKSNFSESCEDDSKEKAMQFIRDFKIGEYKPLQDTSNLHYDYVWLEAIDIAISSERERIKKIIQDIDFHIPYTSEKMLLEMIDSGSLSGSDSGSEVKSK